MILQIAKQIHNEVLGLPMSQVLMTDEANKSSN
jgi:hypothetical protein